MISLIIAIVILVLGYFFYGKLVEKIFGADIHRTTPVTTMADGVDYVPMKPWRMYLIQFLNIAGLGPIFGAIMGAKFGTSALLWIVFGSILAGGVHDYLSAMISLRHNGAGLPTLHGYYLGRPVRVIMKFVTIFLLILTGAVFVSGPAEIIAFLTPDYVEMRFWLVVIFVYYIIATILPVDKIIGKIYPFFGLCLLFMALAILTALLCSNSSLPEIWDGLDNKMPNPEASPIFPMMFISIACGAISGFHATQSPMIAKCMSNEKYGRPIFYGAMICEGVVALIWAAAASFLFYTPEGNALLGGQNLSPASIVNLLCRHWLGPFGAVLAILGVVVAPISTGDTAFRAARLIIAEGLHFEQKTLRNRLMVAVPLFVAGALVLFFSIADKQGFALIWSGFASTNQCLAMVTLWTVTVYLAQHKKWYWISLIPAVFMTSVFVAAFCLLPKIGLGLPHSIGYAISAFVTLFSLVVFFHWKFKKMEKTSNDFNS
ncbi:MAG: carbon starvation protein A [Bacteroidales bacterium]|nr:carbon starvation protein A [Bacteroidales bacterium]